MFRKYRNINYNIKKQTATEMSLQFKRQFKFQEKFVLAKKTFYSTDEED